jgi:DNA-binding MarR family transcriptional regulator
MIRKAAAYIKLLDIHGGGSYRLKCAGRYQVGRGTGRDASGRPARADRRVTVSGGDAGWKATGAPSSGRPLTTYLIGRLDRIVRRGLDEQIRGFELTVLGYTALTVLEARPGLSNAQLARRSFMTPQGMNQVIATLVEKGLVMRTQSTSNRRIQHIELTERGRLVVDQCSVRVAEYEQALLASLAPAERDQLNSLLRTIVNANRRT